MWMAGHPRTFAAQTRALILRARATLFCYAESGERRNEQSWTKAFTHGAAVSDGLVLATVIVWISALWSTLKKSDNCSYASFMAW